MAVPRDIATADLPLAFLSRQHRLAHQEAIAFARHATALVGQTEKCPDTFSFF